MTTPGNDGSRREHQAEAKALAYDLAACNGDHDKIDAVLLRYEESAEQGSHGQLVYLLHRALRDLTTDVVEPLLQAVDAASPDSHIRNQFAEMATTARAQLPK
ncbi:hypothetical protein ACFTWF_03170 [Rhodococcus sp. NPDC056960]|uniref:hypothetical protein n=1 Tax=Rhodococcus sp. NPDC056960 TaxID=3345982 RepID=UPI003645851B